MALPQAKFREIVFQLLFSCSMGHADSDAMIELMMHELSVTKSTMRQALQRVEAIQHQLKEIDEAISKTSQTYTFERIQNVERNILRLGVFELLFDESIPPKVAISEAIRLARKFGTPESASFVNALLDAIYKNSVGQHVDSESVQTSLKLLEESEKVSLENFLAKEESQESRHGIF